MGGVGGGRGGLMKGAARLLIGQTGRWKYKIWERESTGGAVRSGGVRSHRCHVEGSLVEQVCVVTVTSHPTEVHPSITPPPTAVSLPDQQGGGRAAPECKQP